jgi:hypothetical protein
MPDTEPVTRNTVTIDGQRFVLAQGHSLDDIKISAVTAIRDGGGLIDLVLYGNVEISVLVSPGVPVIFTAETLDPAAQDDRDTGDVHAPFDPLDEFTFPA